HFVNGEPRSKEGSGTFDFEASPNIRSTGAAPTSASTTPNISGAARLTRPFWKQIKEEKLDENEMVYVCLYPTDVANGKCAVERSRHAGKHKRFCQNSVWPRFIASAASEPSRANRIRAGRHWPEHYWRMAGNSVQTAFDPED